MAAAQRIVPHLWYDKEANEAARFYCAVFPDSRIGGVTTLHDTPSGDTDVVSFELLGQAFMAISGGPLFAFNPSVSFLVACRTRGEVDRLWQALGQGGTTLLPLDSYPFSERYGWTTDRYGLSWQIMYAGEHDIKQTITPVLMFVGKVCGKAEEAIDLYTSIFTGAKLGTVLRYGRGEEPDKEGTVRYASFELLGQAFAAMDSAQAHAFGFNEAISLMVSCDTQEEIDYYWDRLSHAPEAEQCGWLKDRYGLSWQIVPAGMDEMMRRGREDQIARVTQAFLKMKKLDLAALRQAYEG